MKKVYFITRFDLDGTYSMEELNQLDDDKYKKYVEKNGYSNDFEGFSRDVLSGMIRINHDELFDNSTDSWSYRII